MTDLIGLATTPTGIVVQSALALVCQFVGFGIVVLEIVEARKDFSGLVNRFVEIEAEMLKNLSKHLDQKTLTERLRTDFKAAHGLRNKLVGLIAGAFVKVPIAVTMEIHAATLHKVHELVARNDARQHPKRPWVGAAF